MNLQSLILQNFRNYKKRVLTFDRGITVISGDNSRGKSNILEAIFLLATGTSFRADKDEEMILYGQEFGRVTGEIGETKLSIFLSKPKRFFVNEVAKRKMDFVGNLICVLFRPEDIDLVLGPPSLRRNYLNFVLEQVDREYRRSLLSYQQGVRQRNKLLEKIRDGEADRKQLLFWDQLLIKEGEVISQKREKFIQFVNKRLQEETLKLEYDSSRISPARLEQYADREVWAAKTLVGPHRDDFKFIVQRQGKAEKDLSIYGSRGEQRMAVLAVKLNEFEFIEQETGDRPMLLLDDIFSELDHEHREEVFKLLEKQQTIMTTADKHLIPKQLKHIDLIELNK